MAGLIAAVNTAVNMPAFQLAKSVASPALNSLMLPLASSFLVVIPLIVIYLLYKKDKNVFSLVLAFVLLYVIGEAIKLLVREPRPCTLPSLSWINSVGCDPSFGFPSNHATALTGLVLFMDSYKYLRVLYIVWLLLVLFGRFYLGLHYLTDVLAGVVISVIVAWIFRMYRARINSALACATGRLLPPLSKVNWR